MLPFMSVGGQRMTIEVTYNHGGNSPPNLLTVGQAGGQVPEQGDEQVT